MTNVQLKDAIKNLPDGSGIYMFKEMNNKFLYIGKASNLKSRLNSYLNTDDPRIKKMVELARSLKFLGTDSDIEALILESQLIKKFRPQFNIMMRDDKQYSFIVFTCEKYQKILTTHQPQSHQETIGPFTDAGALKTTLRLLRRIFPYCTCKQLHNNFCLNYHIGKCFGFCCLKQQNPNAKFKVQNLKLYQANIKAIKDIFSGKRVSLIKNLEKEMSRLAKKGDLEKAIEVRNKISDLKRIFENARVIKNSDILKAHRYRVPRPAKARPGNHSETGLESLLKIQKPIIRIEGYDVSNIQGAHATGAMVTFVHGRSDKNFYRKFKIYTKKTPNDVAMLKEILGRRFKHGEWPFPDLILIDGGKGQVNAARATLAALNIFIQVIGISKNERHLGHQLIIPGRKTPLALNKLSPADKNLLLAIASEAHRFAISYYRKLHRKLFK